MNKKINILIILSFLLIILLGGSYTYSRYRTETSGKAVADVANWNISVNNCDIVNPDVNNSTCFASETDVDTGNVIVKKNFNITKINYNSNGNTGINQNKIGPGSSGWFDITIKPNDTEVSIKYLLKITFHENSSIKIYRSDPNQLNKVAMEVDGYNGNLYYTSNGFKLDLNDSTIVDEVTFRIYVDWVNTVDGVNDEADTLIGTSSSTPILDIPVSIDFEQIKE